MTGYCTPDCSDPLCPCGPGDDPRAELAREAGADWYIDSKGQRHDLHYEPWWGNLSSDVLMDLVHDCKSEEASNINNLGTQAQIGYLSEFLTEAELRDYIREAYP